jgi:hypothetical protein
MPRRTRLLIADSLLDELLDGTDPGTVMSRILASCAVSRSGIR